MSNVEAESKDNFYYISANCINCGWFESDLAIPKGMAARIFLHTKKCPHCGCSDVLEKCAPKIPVPENWRGASVGDEELWFKVIDEHDMTPGVEINGVKVNGKITRKGV